RAAVAFDLGVIIADVLFIALAYFSSYQLLENLSNQPGLYVFGGTILAIYGSIIFFKKPKKEIETHTEIVIKRTNYYKLFLKGFFLNFINIGVLVFWLGVIIVVSPNLDNDVNRFITFFGAMLGAYFVTDIFKILLAKQLKSKLTPELIIRIKKLLGLIL